MRLLLAEDDPELSARLARYLGKQGFAVDSCTDGMEAEFNGREMPYDVIVLDLGLPKRPGLEVLASWRKAQAYLTLISSAYCVGVRRATAISLVTWSPAIGITAV